MTDLFTQSDETLSIDPEKDYFEELVGEGKSFTDAKALARAKVESNLFIERLKTENAGIRQELNSRVKMEEFIDRMETLQKQTKSPSNERDAPDHEMVDQKGLTTEDITKLLDNRLTERERLSKASQNVELVKNKLQEVLGPNYATKLEQMTNNLGLSREYLNSIASNSPTAFLKLVGVTADRSSTTEDVFTPPPRSQVNPDAFRPSDTATDKNYKHYERIFKSDPTLYWSPKIQNELTATRRKMGAKFFQS